MLVGLRTSWTAQLLPREAIESRGRMLGAGPVVFPSHVVYGN